MFTLWTVYINNSLQRGVVPIRHMFIPKLECGIFYVDENDHMGFQRSDEICKAHTEHLFHMRLEFSGKAEADSYH